MCVCVCMCACVLGVTSTQCADMPLQTQPEREMPECKTSRGTPLCMIVSSSIFFCTGTPWPRAQTASTLPVSGCDASYSPVSCPFLSPSLALSLALLLSFQHLVRLRVDDEFHQRFFLPLRQRVLHPTKRRPMCVTCFAHARCAGLCARALARVHACVHAHHPTKSKMQDSRTCICARHHAAGAHPPPSAPLCLLADC